MSQLKVRLITSDMKSVIWAVRELPDAEMRHDDGELFDGMCDPPHKKNKTIRIRQGLEPLRHLEVVIHEALHAMDQSKDDDWITQAAKQLANLLWKCEYRRISRSEYDETHSDGSQHITGKTQRQ